MKIPFDSSQLGLAVTVGTVAAAIGSGSYAFWCWQENKNPADLEKVIRGLGCFLLALFVAPVIMFLFWLANQGWWATLMLLPIPAGWLHYKMGKASLSWIGGILLMSAVFFTSVAIALVAVILLSIFNYWLWRELMWGHELNFKLVYFASLCVYTVIAPMANWVLRGLKARPGVEVDLKP